MNDPPRRRRSDWLGPAVVALLIGVYALWSAAHLGGAYWDTDEGINLMKARMLQLGYRLYADIWADQPPGLTVLLAWAFALFGPTVTVARGLVLAHALVCLAAVAWLVRELGGGWVAAATAVVALALAPNFFWASRAVMIGLPALSLGVLAMAAALAFQRSGRRGWLVMAGLLLGASLLEKLIAAYLAIPFALAVVMRRPDASRGASAANGEDGPFRAGGVGWARAAAEAIRPATADLGIIALSVAVPLVVALAAFDVRAMLDQVVGTVARARDVYPLDLTWNVDKLRFYLLGDHLTVTVLAAYGAVALARRWSAAGVVVLTWLGLTIVALLTQAPLWPKHHFLALLVILAPLAGLAVEDIGRGLGRIVGRGGSGWRRSGPSERERGGLWRSGGEWWGDEGPGRGAGGWRLVRAAVGVAVGVAVVLVALWGAPALVRADVARFAAVPFKESGKLPKNEAWRHQDAAVALVREMTHPNDFIITDYHMIAFLSGRKVPPELAVISGKRLAVGALGDHQLIAITERYRPAALLLWSGDRLSSMWGYTRWLRESRYRIARTLGDEFTLLVPDVPELMPLRLAEAGEGG